MRQQKILGLIVIFLIVKELESKALNSNIRNKRGYGGNEYDSTVHVSSGILQYGKATETSSSGHYDVSSVQEDPWKNSGLSPGYEVWLEPSSSYHPSSSAPDIHTSITLTHPGSDLISNNVFSDSSDHSGHNEVPTSQLHTQIISSNAGSTSSHSIADHSISTISDNIDFNNVSDIKSKHYAKSYGK